MTNNSTKSLASQSEAKTAIPLLDDWFDPIEAACAIGCASSSRR
jgi:hypothetical protein